MLSRSLRISRPSWDGKIPIRKSVIALCMITLCLNLMPVGEMLFPLPLHYLILGLDIFALLAIRHTGDLDYGMDLLPFLAVVFITVVLQQLLAGGYYSSGMAISTAIILFAMIIGIILITQRGYASLLWKILNFFTLLSAGCIILQMLCRYVGIHLDGLGILSKVFFNAWRFNYAYRPCGMFAEPAIFAQPALLSLFYYMFIGKSLKKTAFLTVALLLSTSALGLMGVIGLYIIWIFNMDKLSGIPKSRKWAILSLTAVAGMAVFTFALNMEVFVVERLTSGSSIGVRVLRSVDLYKLMEPHEKLIGIGLQNQAYYLNYHNIILAHDTYETTYGGSREYAGTLGYVLCTTGFFGLVTYVQPVFRYFRRCGLQVKVICLLVGVSALFCAMLATPFMMVSFLVMYATVDLEREGVFDREEADDAEDADNG